MNDKLRESLSALMDNEGDELELRRTLKSLDESPDTTAVWRRYHLARSLMQRDREIDTRMDLSAGVMAQIATEPLPELAEQPTGRRHGGLSFAGSAAVAATVSLMVIGGVQVYNGSDATTSTEVADQGTTAAGSSQGLKRQGAQPASTATLADESAGLPLYPSFGSGNGVMTVGAEFSSPMFMAPNQRQSQRSEIEQARLLQSYLNRHAQGEAYRSGEPWMPLLRASAQEPLDSR